MKKILHKIKGFTLTELAIVIAVIAILIAVLVPTFISLINSANETSDMVLVSNLNKSLSITDEPDTLTITDNGTDKTVYNVTTAITSVRADGYDVSKLSPTADGGDIVYNASTNKFLYYADNFSELAYGDEPESTDVLVIVTDSTLSRYGLAEESKLTGANTIQYCVYSEEGVDISTDEIICIWVYTEGGTSTINAANSVVNRYGVSDSDEISVAEDSYHLYGTVNELLLTQGHVEFKSTAVVNTFTIDSTAIGTPSVTIVQGATISEFNSESSVLNGTSASYTLYTKESDSETGKGDILFDISALDIISVTSVKLDECKSISTSITLLSDIKTESVIVDLNGTTLTTTSQLTIKNSSIKTLTIKNGIIQCDYNSTSSGNIRIEKGTTVNFIDVEFTTSKTSSVLAIQTNYATNSQIEYTFTDCTFDNTFIKLNISSGSDNNCDAVFNYCSFINNTSSNNCVYFDSSVYGTAVFNECNFDVTGSVTAIYVNADSSGTFDVTLNSVEYTGTAVPDTYVTKYTVPTFVSLSKTTSTVKEKGTNEYWLKFGTDSTDLYSFTGCTSITSLNIPETVTEIPEVALKDLTSLTSITVSSGSTSYKVISNNLYTYDGKTLVYYIGANNVASFTIPDTVTKINAYAFYLNKVLTEVVIPDSVAEISNYAFYKCSNIVKVTIGENVTNISSYAFADCTSLVTITIPDSVTTIETYAFSQCTALVSVTIGKSVTTIGTYAFNGCTNMKEVYNLSSLTITAGKTSNGYIAQYAKNVYTTESESNMVTVNDYLFYNNSGSYSLVGYAGLDTVLTLPTLTIGGVETNYTIDEKAFYQRTTITSVTIPDSVTSIGKYAFGSCTSLISVTIGENVATIGSYAFNGCSALTSIVIPDAVTSIGDNAFYNCSKLSSITIGANVTSIGGSAFYKCTSLTSIVIPGEVTSIGNSAFNSCSALTSIVIPNSVTSIGNSAFASCNALTSVYYTGTSSEWDSITFGTVGNNSFKNIARFYYSESQPTDTGNYWRYVEGVPTPWNS